MLSKSKKNIVNTEWWYQEYTVKKSSCFHKSINGDLDCFLWRFLSLKQPVNVMCDVRLHNLFTALCANPRRDVFQDNELSFPMHFTANKTLFNCAPAKKTIAVYSFHTESLLSYFRAVRFLPGCNHFLID